MKIKTTGTFLFAIAFAGAACASPALDLARQLNQAFIEVADKVSPSVVVINVVQKGSDIASDTADGSPWDLLPRELRKQFRKQFEQQLPQEKTHGQGSGIILRKDGFILTNRHVVENAEKIEVRLQDGRRFAAAVRGEDAQSDVAVIKIDAHDLPAATLADSDQTRVGEFAIAIGAPFALDYSVTFGHVSAKGRSGVIYDPAMDQEFIQTDANINPGNSGGPLVNIDGHVIGINTLIRGMHTGIGFAIPINLAREISDKLIATGHLTRARLGIGIRSLKDDADFQELNPGVKDGIIVTAIEPGGPAADSELRPADVIVAIDGKPVSTAQDLKNAIRNKTIGNPVALDVIRNGKAVKLAVKPGPWMDNSDNAETFSSVPKDGEAASLGLTVQTLTPALAEQFGVAMTRGVVVTSIEQGGVADRRGIKPGDVITEINHQPVATPREFRAAVQSANIEKGVILNLVNGKTSRFEILKKSDE